MGLLGNITLDKLATAGVVENSSSRKKTWDVKGASIDLTVGDIFLPGAKVGEPGSPRLPTDQIILAQGHTVVIRTGERLHLDLDHAGIAFPAAGVSLQGLLMTNPGHIDPGYDGPLHITVINMGREAFCLKRGERLMRCLIFRLDSTATVPGPVQIDPITEKLMSRLSSDFLSIEERASETATREVARAEAKLTKWQFGAPIVVAILACIASFFGSYLLQADRLTKLEVTSPVAQLMEARLSRIETLLPMEQRVNMLEGTTLRSLDERVKKIENERKK